MSSPTVTSAALREQAFTAVDALRAVINSQKRSADAWVKLGNTLPNGVSAEIDSEWFDATTCFFHALKIDESHAEAWLSLGASLTKFMNAQFLNDDLDGPEHQSKNNNNSSSTDDGSVSRRRRKEVTQQQCFENAIALAKDARIQQAAWLHLGASLDPKVGVATVGGEKFSATECLAKASMLKAVVEAEKVINETVHANRPFGKEPTPSSSSSSPKQRNNNNDAEDDEEISRPAPAFPPSFWLCLADAIGKNETAPNEQQHDEAKDPASSSSLHHQESSSSSPSPATAAAASPQQQPTIVSAATTKSITVSTSDGTTLTIPDKSALTRLVCYENAVEAAHGDLVEQSKLWLCLEAELEDQMRQRLLRSSAAGDDYDDDDEQEEGTDGQEEEETENNNTSKEIIVMVDQHHHSHHLQKNEPVCHIFGETLTRLDCCLRAVDASPNNSEAWLRLSEHIDLHDHAYVTLLDAAETKVTKRSAIEKSILLSPTSSQAWVCLAECLNPSAAVSAAASSQSGRGSSSAWLKWPSLFSSSSSASAKKAEQQNSAAATSALGNIFFVPLDLVLAHKTDKLPLQRQYTSLTCLERAVSLDPNNPKAWLALCTALECLQRDSKDLHHLQQQVSGSASANATSHHPQQQQQQPSACVALPSNQTGLLASGNKIMTLSTTATKEQRVTAKMCLEQALSLNPSMPFAWKKMALILSDEADADMQEQHEKQRLDSEQKQQDNKSKNKSGGGVVPSSSPQKQGLVGDTSTTGATTAEDSDSKKKKSLSQFTSRAVAAIRRRIPFFGNREPLAHIRGKPVTFETCLVKCVETNETSAESWLTLGMFLAGKHGNIHSSSSSSSGGTTTISLTIDEKNNNNNNNNKKPSSSTGGGGGGKNAIKRQQQQQDQTSSSANAILSPTRQQFTIDAVFCFIKNIELDPWSTLGWSYLGASMQSHRATVHVSGEDFSQEDCFEQAKAVDLRASAAWIQKGLDAAEADQQKHPMSTKRSKKCIEEQVSCFVRATRLEPDDFLAWAHLGLALPVGQKVRITETTYTKVECLTKAANMEPDNGRVWLYLGQGLQFGEQIRIRADLVGCGRRQEEDDDDDDDEPRDRKLRLEQQRMQQQQQQPEYRLFDRLRCFERAVLLNPGDAEAWMEVGKEMLMAARKKKKDNCNYNDDDNEEQEEDENDEEEEEEDEEDDDAVKIIPSVIVIDGHPYTKRNCFEAAVTLDPVLAIAWTHLATTLEEGECAVVGGEEKNKEECFFLGLQSL